MTGQDLKILLKIVGELDPSAAASVKAAAAQLGELGKTEKELAQTEREQARAAKELAQARINAGNEVDRSQAAATGAAIRRINDQAAAEDRLTATQQRQWSEQIRMRTGVGGEYAGIPRNAQLGSAVDVEAAAHRQLGEQLMMTRRQDASEASAKAALSSRYTAEAVKIEAAQVAQANTAWHARASAIDTVGRKQEAALNKLQPGFTSGGATGGAGGGGGGGRGVIGNIGNDIGKVAEWAVATAAIYGTIQMLRHGIEVYSEFEVETVKLGWAGKNIAAGFASQHEAAVALTSTILGLKVAYGSAGTEAMQAADVFARLGENQGEIARDTGVAVKLGRIGGMPAQEVARLGEAMRLEFGLASEEFEKVADKLAKIGFMGPATIKGLLEGGSRVGGVWKQAGGQLDEVFAIIAAGRMGGRTESEVANAVRTMMVRLGQPTHQEKLYEITKRATGTGMEFGDAAGNAKAPWEIFRELKSIFSQMNDKGRDDLSKQLGFEVGGTRGANILQSIMTNFATAEDVLKKERDGSGGELNRKSGESLDTLSGASARVTAAFDVLAANTSTLGLVMTSAMKALEILLSKNAGVDQSERQRLVEREAAIKSQMKSPLRPGGLEEELATVQQQLYKVEHPGSLLAKSKEQFRTDISPAALEEMLQQERKQVLAEGPMGPQLPTEGPMGPQLPMDEQMGPPVPEGERIKGSLEQAHEIKSAISALEEQLRHAKGSDAIHKLAMSFDELRDKAAKAGATVKDSVEGFIDKQKVDEKIANSVRSLHAASGADWQSEEGEIKARAKLDTFRKYGRGAGSAVETNEEERRALLTMQETLRSTNPSSDPSSTVYKVQMEEKENALLEIEERLRMNAKGLVTAQLQDELKTLETQKQKTDQLAKQLGMLSDEDMLKTRILAGEMRRGEIKKSMDVGEFVNLPQGDRKRYEMLGGHVTGKFGGMDLGEGGPVPAPAISGAAPVVHSQPPRPPMRPGMLSAAESGGNVDGLAVAIAREMRVQLATLFPIPVTAEGTREPRPMPSGTASVTR